MISTPALEFVIRGPGGAERRLIVDCDRACVGSGASSEVRLAPEEAAAEQLWIEARGGQVFAEARAASPPVFVDGAPLSAGPLAPGSVLTVGRTTLRVRVVERHPRASTAARGRVLMRLCAALGGVGIPLGILLAGPRSAAEDWSCCQLSRAAKPSQSQTIGRSWHKSPGLVRRIGRRAKSM